MIDLNRLPRTDAEAHAAYLLTKVAQTGAVYHELFNSMPTSSTLKGFDYLKSVFPSKDDMGAADYCLRTAKEEFTDMDKALNLAIKFVGETLMQEIDNFNEACNAVKSDKRLRKEILESEGWQRTENGWTRGKTTIVDRRQP